MFKPALDRCSPFVTANVWMRERPRNLAPNCNIPLRPMLEKRPEQQQGRARRTLSQRGFKSNSQLPRMYYAMGNTPLPHEKYVSFCKATLQTCAVMHYILAPGSTNISSFEKQLKKTPEWENGTDCHYRGNLFQMVLLGHLTKGAFFVSLCGKSSRERWECIL